MVDAKNELKRKPISERSVSVNLDDLYSFKPEDIVLEISGEHYSNFAYIQVTPREVYIDFLPVPGVKKDGKMVIQGTRIYMSHSAAQNLSERLGVLLENVHRKKGMETYVPKEAKKAESERENQ
jgi:hypothetical protein